MDRKFATQFREMRVQINEPRAAFDMYIAVWSVGGSECVIGAPSLEALSNRWAQMTRTTLDASRAQHVLVMKCEAPEALMNAAKAIAAGEEPRP